jgi:hypothetical protein
MNPRDQFVDSSPFEAYTAIHVNRDLTEN